MFTYSLWSEINICLLNFLDPELLKLSFLNQKSLEKFFFALVNPFVGLGEWINLLISILFVCNKFFKYVFDAVLFVLLIKLSFVNISLPVWKLLLFNLCSYCTPCLAPLLELFESGWWFRVIHVFILFLDRDVLACSLRSKQLINCE